MNRLFYLCTIFLLAFGLKGYGQDIIFDKPHIITFVELANPLVPLVSENSRKEYFIRHVYSEQANYGGLMSKKRFTASPDLLSYYKSTNLFHLSLQKQSAIIGTDTTSQITYYTNPPPPT